MAESSDRKEGRMERELSLTPSLDRANADSPCSDEAESRGARSAVGDIGKPTALAVDQKGRSATIHTLYLCN